MIDDFFGAGFDVLCVAYVAGKTFRFDALGLCLVHRIGGRFVIHQREFCAHFAERERHGFTQAPASAGDDGDAAT